MPSPGLDVDVVAVYRGILAQDASISMSVAAILTLSEVVESSSAETMFELVQALNVAAEKLKTSTSNHISLTAGAELFIAFVTLSNHENKKFEDVKNEIAREGRAYAEQSSTYRQKIALEALKFIKDDAVILTHSYSRVVMQVLQHAHRHRRISVYVTEARPRGLGVRTAEHLSKLGIPCKVILDTAVAYVIDKVDLVLVGSEAVNESGGLVNAIGSNQIAIVAKASHKPFYAVAESYKFHRSFPLSQFDLPSHSAKHIEFSQTPRLSTTQITSGSAREARYVETSVDLRSASSAFTMSSVEISQFPEVDYTRPELITLVFSDVGILTPSGVSQYLVGMFAG